MPDRAYLNFKSENGCQSWCSRDKNNSQWLQVNFGGQRQLVTEVATQGRGDANSFVKKYDLLCTLDGITYTKIDSFVGNTNNTGIVTQKLKEPTWCRAVRFNPTEWVDICMRVEVYYS